MEEQTTQNEKDSREFIAENRFLKNRKKSVVLS